MAEPSGRDRLKSLEERLDRTRRERERQDRPATRGTAESYNQATLAWRMVIELVAGLALGFGIGYGLDWLFATVPVFLVVFTLLGFAAGVRTMMRTAGEVAARGGGAAARDRKD